MHRDNLLSRWISRTFRSKPSATIQSRKVPRPRVALGVEELESRLTPATLLPVYFNVPTDVANAGVYIAITGKDPASSPTDQGLYFQFGGQSGGAYSGSYVDLSASTTSIPLQKLSFQTGTPPQGDTQDGAVPVGDEWVQVNLPDTLVDSGQIIMFIGPNSPASLPVVSSGSGMNTVYNVTAPSPLTYPNNTFDLFEYSVVTNTGAGGGTTSFIDISNVDSIGAPFTVQTNPISTAPTNQGVGIQLTFQQVQSLYSSFLQSQSYSGAQDFNELILDNSLGVPDMIEAPNHGIDGDSTTGPKLGTGPTSGGTLTPSTYYYYAVTAVTPEGETAITANSPSATFFETGAASSNDYAIQLAWSPVTGATGYNVYRYDTNSSTAPGSQPANSQFQLIGTLGASETAFLDQGGETIKNVNPPSGPPAAASISSATPEWVQGGSLENNQTYYYEIAAVNASGEASAVTSFTSAAPTHNTSSKAGTPSLAENAMQLTLPQAATGVVSYNIYRSVGTSSDFTLLSNIAASTTTTTTYVDDVGPQPPQAPPPGPPALTLTANSGASSLKIGTYYYEYTYLNSNGVESSPSASAQITTTSSNPTVQIGFNNVPTNTGILLYRSSTGTAGSFDYEAYFGSGTGTVYDQGTFILNTSDHPPSSTLPVAPTTAPLATPLAGGNLTTGNYYYQITAITSSGQTAASPNSSPITLPAGDKSIQLSWTPYTGATGYKIYRSSTGAPGSFYLLGTVGSASTTYIDTGIVAPNSAVPTALPGGPTIEDPAVIPNISMLAAGTYYYEITAIGASGGESMASNYILANVANTDTDDLRLSWPTVQGATGYNIYRRTSSSGPFDFYATTNNTFYLDTGTGTTESSQTPPANSYNFDPLSSYFTNNLVQFFENYTSPSNSFTFIRNGYTFTAQTTTITDTGSDNQSHTYVVFQLSSNGTNTTSAYDVAAFQLNVYAPFFTSNYIGSNPFSGSSDPALSGYTVPPPPKWMVDGSEMPGSMVFGGSGVFNTGSDDPNSNTYAPGLSGYIIPGTAVNVLSDVENSIDAAFNRGIAVAVPGGQGAVPADNWADLPVALSATASKTGGSLAAPGDAQNAYYYVITAVNAQGQSPTSNEIAAAWTTGDNNVQLTWQAPAAADAPVAPTGYDIYRATSPNGPWTLVNTSGPVTGTTYTDKGGGTSNTNPPYFFYASGSASNYYSAFLHQSSTLLPGNPNNGVSINGLAYGFAYDDQGGQSTTIAVNNLKSLQVNFEPLGTTISSPGSTPATLYKGRIRSANPVLTRLLNSRRGDLLLLLESSSHGTTTSPQPS